VLGSLPRGRYDLGSIRRYRRGFTSKTEWVINYEEDKYVEIIHNCHARPVFETKFAFVIRDGEIMKQFDGCRECKTEVPEELKNIAKMLAFA